MLELLPMLLVSTLIAGIVQGISGFAFAIIFLAMMQPFLPYMELLSLSSILCVIMLVINAYRYRKYIVWKWIPLPVVINFTFTMGAIYVLNGALNFPYWHKLLGIVFIFLSGYMYFFQSKIKIRPTFTNALLFCGIGGILGGLFGVGGPPVVLYFLAVADSKEHYIGTTQMFFLFNMIYDFIGRILSGMVTAVTLQNALLSVPTILIGLWIGARLFERIDAEILKKIVYFLMFLDGCYMLLT